MFTYFMSSATCRLWLVGFCLITSGLAFQTQTHALKTENAFEYLFPHFPATAGAWEATLVLMNPGYEIVTTSVESFQQDPNGSADTYLLEQSFSQSLLPYQVLEISDQLPQESGDRWVRLTADRELSGWIQFRLKANPKHQTTLPLQKASCIEGTRHFPHVPSDRDQFWSGFALVNLGEAAPVNFQLWGKQGENLNHLLIPGQQGQILPENGKRLAIFEGVLFNDRDQAEKVAWVTVEGGPDLQAMMLFGNQGESEFGDLAGVNAHIAPEISSEYRFGIGPTHGDVNGFVLVNPHQTPLTLTLKIFDVDGNLAAEHSANLNPREKRLALWTGDTFELEGEDTPILSQSMASQSLGTLVIEGSQELTTLQLAFQHGGQIEGVQALAQTTHVATSNFSQNLGQLVVHNQSDRENTVNLWGFTPAGVRTLAEQWQLQPQEVRGYPLDDAAMPSLSYFLAQAETPISLQWQSSPGETLTKTMGHSAAPESFLPDPATLTITPDPNAIAVRDVWADWVKRESHPLASITANTFEDLQFLHDAIGSRSLVQLGESSHGAQEFSQAKVRMIKFLHQQMGFNVVAFESGFFECETAINRPNTNGPRLLQNSIFAVWATEEVAELFEYILQTQTTSRPLKLSGFDHQVSSFIGSQNRGGILYDAFAPLDPTIANQIRQQEIQWEQRSFSRDFLSNNAAVLAPLYQQGLDRVQAYLDQNPAGTVISREQALFLKGSFIAMLAQIEISGVTGFNYGVIRDRVMAELLGFLATEVYPEEKIAVWAHNAHIMYQSETLDLFGPVRRMGSYLEEPFRDALYTVGFYMYRGFSATNIRTPAQVQAPDRENSLEAILHTAGKPYLFVDLLQAIPEEGNAWMRQDNPPIRAWYWGGPGFEDLVLENHYDAILFIDETQMPRYLR